MAIGTSIEAAASARPAAGSAESDPLAARYARDGCLFPLRVLAPGEAEGCWRRMQALERERPEDAEAAFSFNPHYVLPWLYDLARRPRILDAVERVIGPDVLVWSTGFFNKRARDPAYVSWHQDSTYWGLEPPDVVTAWIAFTPSRSANGCMRVVPGTHALGQLDHGDGFAENNLLSRGQEVQWDVDERQAVDVELEPGEMSLHHVRIVHGSNPNPTETPRIGFIVRYVAAHCRQRGGRVPAALVRGEDRYGHFDPLPCPKTEFDPAAMAFSAAAKPVIQSILFEGAERRGQDAGQHPDGPVSARRRGAVK